MLETSKSTKPNIFLAQLSRYTVSHKPAKSMAKLASLSCGNLQLSVCLSRKDGTINFKHHPSTHGLLTNLRNKPQLKQPGQLSAATLLALIVN